MFILQYISYISSTFVLILEYLFSSDLVIKSQNMKIIFLLCTYTWISLPIDTRNYEFKTRFSQYKKDENTSFP